MFLAFLSFFYSSLVFMCVFIVYYVYDFMLIIMTLSALFVSVVVV